ncbi:MAG: ferredoxin [Nanoarchaeota archaeon]|nr:ferredoxin [Nanoarchaeota archaeon]|tara:strand:- start:3184 stop:3414 length:231 start_codon:yes stop_codon:yes gene_type:complete
MTHKITHIKPECIGCQACAAIAPEFWEMNEDGISHLKESKVDDKGNEILEIPEEDVELNKEAAEACPVQIIKVEKL